MTTKYEKKLLEAIAEWKLRSIIMDFGTLLANATSPHPSQQRQDSRQAILLLPHGKEILKKETRE